jgi:hypothetical protein
VALGRNANIDLVKNVPLLAWCSKSELKELAMLADEIDLRDGHVLTRERRSGREFSCSSTARRGSVAGTRRSRICRTSRARTNRLAGHAVTLRLTRAGEKVGRLGKRDGPN